MEGNKGNEESSRTELVIKITITKIEKKKKEEKEHKKEMYIYLIDPAGKEYIMYQKNQIHLLILQKNIKTLMVIR